MSLNSAASSVTPELQNLLDRCDFLQLTTTKETFPASKGSGLPLIRVNTPKCAATIALQGAHLLTFRATGGSPLLWVSPNCDFTPCTALRGGVPICLPWFGPDVLDPKKPKHGFARNRDWILQDAKLSSDGDAELLFTFASKANELFAYNFSAQLLMTLGEAVTLEISVNNDDPKPFDCSWVLHSYFPVESLANVRVKGLAGRTYLDNLENHAPKIQNEDVDFPCEVDRVFPAIENSLEIQGSPSIHISHHNCPSVVVWNPGPVNAAKITDIGEGNEQAYICVERGAVLAEKWHLAAGESRAAWMSMKEIFNNK